MGGIDAQRLGGAPMEGARTDRTLLRWILVAAEHIVRISGEPRKRILMIMVEIRGRGGGFSESGRQERDCHRRADRRVLRQLPTAYIRNNSYESTQLNLRPVTSAVSADSVVVGPEI
jgi:hypothetical protein